MNIVCRLCRSWILQRRIQAHVPRMQQVTFAWTHDAVLTRILPAAAALEVGKDLSRFRADAAELRIGLYRALLRVYLGYKQDYRDVLPFAPNERMMAARAPLVRKVRNALRRLDERQRLIVSLVDLGGCSYLETAQILDLPREALLDALCNARVQLKAQLFGVAGTAQTDAQRSGGRQ